MNELTWIRAPYDPPRSSVPTYFREYPDDGATGPPRNRIGADWFGRTPSLAPLLVPQRSRGLFGPGALSASAALRREVPVVVISPSGVHPVSRSRWGKSHEGSRFLGLQLRPRDRGIAVRGCPPASAPEHDPTVVVQRAAVVRTGRAPSVWVHHLGFLLVPTLSPVGDHWSWRQVVAL
jgi:hypothetical protein